VIPDGEEIEQELAVRPSLENFIASLPEDPIQIGCREIPEYFHMPNGPHKPALGQSKSKRDRQAGMPCSGVSLSVARACR